MLIAAAVLSWLVAFNVVNTRNHIVAMVGDFLYAVTEPVLRPIRNLLPSLGGIDISPVILMIGLFFLDKLSSSGCIYPDVTVSPCRSGPGPSQPAAFRSSFG